MYTQIMISKLKQAVDVDWKHTGTSERRLSVLFFNFKRRQLNSFMDLKTANVCRGNKFYGKGKLLTRLHIKIIIHQSQYMFIKMYFR